LAAWRMRVERELACDDCVLLVGENPTAYARVLVDLADRWSAPRLRSLPITTVSMLARSNLEERVRGILDLGRLGTAVSRGKGNLLMLSASAIAISLGVWSPYSSLVPSVAIAAESPPRAAAGDSVEDSAQPESNAKDADVDLRRSGVI